MKDIDIIGICNALVDILIEVDDTDLQALGLTKGIMHLVDRTRQDSVLKHFSTRPRTIELGGSGMNAVRTLAALGKKTGFCGMIAPDDFGERIQIRMNQLKIDAHLSPPNTKVDGHNEGTGSCVILITPDGERTMNTNLGVSHLYDEDHIPHEAIKKAKLVHFTGYQWDTPRQKTAIRSALKTAKDHGAVTSFDLADPFVVNRHREELIKVIEDEANIVFANREEARLLFGTTPEDAAAQISKKYNAIAVVKLGADGALIQSGDKIVKVASVPTQVVDTTAAGDMFAAGFLNGFLDGRDLETCGKMAALLAGDVISRIGATISDNALASVQRL